MPESSSALYLRLQLLDDNPRAEDSAGTKQPLQAVWLQRHLQRRAKLRIHLGDQGVASISTTSFT